MPLLDILFLSVVALAIFQKFVEYIYSRKNQSVLKLRGFALRESNKQSIIIQTFTLTWFVAMLAEGHFHITSVPEWLRVIALLAYILSQAIMLWSINSLGSHWSKQIFAPEKVDTPSTGSLTPEAMISGISERVKVGLKEDLFAEKGPYKYVRHPCYLALIIETASLPIFGGAAITALLFSIWLNHLLKKYIDLEESWLFSRPGYHELFYHKSRFIPF